MTSQNAAPQPPNKAAPAKATDAVLVASEPVPEGVEKVQGIDFDKYADHDLTVKEMIQGMANMGFQSTAISEAARIINEMVGLPHRRHGGTSETVT